MNVILKNISWIFGAHLLVALTKWLILVFIARLLMPEDLGVYSLAFAITAPIALFVNFKLRDLIVTEESPIFSDYALTRNITSLLALIFMIIISFCFYPKYLLVILLVGINKILDLHSELYYSMPHINNHFDFIGKLMILKHVIILMFFFLSLLYTKNLIFSLFIQVIIQYIFFIFVEKKNILIKYKPIMEKKKIKKVKELLKIGLPLGVSMMLISLTANIPKYMLEFFESAEVLGYFSAITYVLVIGNLVMKSISQNFLPKLSNEYLKKDVVSFNKYIFKYLTTASILLGILFITGTYLFGEFFLTIVYGSNFAGYVEILIVASYAMAINFIGWNFDTGLMSIRSIKIQPIISITTVILSTIFGFILIYNYGIKGAAYTMLITNIFQTVLRYVFLKIEIKKKMN